MTGSQYTAEPVTRDNALSDVRVHVSGKTWHLWGRAGLEREERLADTVPEGALPVLIGSGLGRCLDILLECGFDVAVVDREAPLLSLTGVREKTDGHPNVLWVDDPDPRTAFRHIEDWAAQCGGRPLHPVVIPLYPRLDRDYYTGLIQRVKASGPRDFWATARYPKFRSVTPRALFFDSRYFLCDEIRAALDRLGVEHRSIPLDNLETGSNRFIEKLLKTVVDFRPDFVLTVNHFGLDREGRLAGLLDDLGLPLASWFVDNPHLILFDYAHPGADNTVLFTFDADNLEQLREKGFSNVHHLPLATDPKRFRPGLAGDAAWTADVSFVGNSMTRPVADALSRTALPERLINNYPDVARAFGRSGAPRVDRFLARHRPDWSKAVAELPARENRLACESLLTWEATRQYRLACVDRILPFSPLIVGDDAWKELLPPTGWRHLPPLDYYSDLPRFYPLSKVNFNCTSRQMPGAVNQRLFDVPACGGFLITDHRRQMEDLFDLDTEVAVYREPGEIQDLAASFLADPKQRARVTENARRRILAEHTYDLRLGRLMDILRATFA